MGCSIKRIIQFNNAITTCDVAIFDNLKNDITTSCSYSWSVDGVCWSPWTDHNTFRVVTPRLESDFYLRILISTGLSDVVIDNCITSEYTIAIDASSVFLKDFCGDANLFQPYNNLDCAIQLQQQLSDSVACMFGIPIYYFKTGPKTETLDYTFKEYVLHNVTAVKQLKLIIPDGTMPSSNPKLTEFDFDWETDWETEISKTHFANAFGDDAYPKYGDFIYIPMMHRMWDVNAAYDEKNEGLMWRSTTWKLSLVKYSDSTAFDTSEFDNLIDSLIPKTYENTFGQFETIEQERISQSPQVSAPMFAATNLFDIFMEDAIRQQYTKNDIAIIDKQYNHRANVVSRNMYRFKNENGCVTYQKGMCGDDGTLMFIVETPGSFSGVLERDIIQFGNLRVNMKWDSGKFKMICNDLQADLVPFKSYMCVIRWNRINYTMSLDVYDYKHREDIPIYKLRPEMYWFDFQNPICSLVTNYDNELSTDVDLPCQVHGYPLQLTNIKYYNEYLNDEEVYTESVRYTTNHKSCVFNDSARPITSGHGYAIK